MRRTSTIILTRLYDMRELSLVVAMVGLGITLAFGLYSPSQDLTIALAGLSVFVVVILINPLKGLLLWLIIV